MILRSGFTGIIRGVLLAFLLLLPLALFSQGYFGTVSGELTDPSGAVIQGAKVVLTDQARGFTYNATSDSAGRYLFTAIPPGLYTVSAEMQGFEKGGPHQRQGKRQRKRDCKFEIASSCGLAIDSGRGTGSNTFDGRCSDRSGGQSPIHQ